jgi:hypothetical protein
MFSWVGDARNTAVGAMIKGGTVDRHESQGDQVNQVNQVNQEADREQRQQKRRAGTIGAAMIRANGGGRGCAQVQLLCSEE